MWRPESGRNPGTLSMSSRRVVPPVGESTSSSLPRTFSVLTLTFSHLWVPLHPRQTRTVGLFKDPEPLLWLCKLETSFYYIKPLKHGNFYFFIFWLHLWHMEFLGQGMDLSHSCDQCHSCGNTRSLTLCATVGTPKYGNLFIPTASVTETSMST